MDRIQQGLLAAVLGLILVLVVFQLQSRTDSKSGSSSPYCKPTYLIVGANGAGKTSLFYSLTNRTQNPASFVSSLEPNVASVRLPFANESIQKLYQLIDYPGHLKHSELLRTLILDDITVGKLKGVIYVVDSSSVSLSQELKVSAMAKELFLLLSTTEKNPNGVDFLFAVNKQDLFDSRPVHKVKQVLEDELAKLVADEISAKGLARGGSGIDNDDLEDDDEEKFRKEESTRDFWKAVVGSLRFSFDFLEGNMEFVGGSVLKGAVGNWENWFDEKAVNYGGI
ncbi:P-loop containing nucleoside triphosphate hydrolase protein [Metschnikowia bicuspidata var. bicuspidata NRRL YB-4993]|uniref:Signal recognition particle receptor subunit beta n=1 Tax=Metschnikowia bicuspidata var. bicuspidata NRRL YB-4993 TaxID=869754 RepID=A0A1A0H5Z6_9ASCO|nr:P-loop containing nucleoside triphosphate hydrolase protein [Metschnikowia bicuspidata var. bicuspidata NRRL YB-4993]OBA19509.1 P-loop containing nucleoside triphosphate hydrolase protein [Metschnikowia bicuspidata var. bicuspidata NRRL YB-4993]